MRRAVRRFMPGETMEEALGVASSLPIPVVLTNLGENVHDTADAEAVSEHYRNLLDSIYREGVRAEVSVKPTHLGLDLGEEVCFRNLRSIVESQERLDGNGAATVWIDMEDSSYVDRTLSLTERMQGARVPVGVCLQAYLHRTPADLERLVTAGVPIRLVKGAYREPPEVAIASKREVDRVYMQLAGRLAAQPPAQGRHVLGTHDERILRALVGGGEGEGLGGLEVHMLYGIARAEGERLVRERVPLRVLISYGEHWFPWYMRRLAERPANLWFVFRSMFRR